MLFYVVRSDGSVTGPHPIGVIRRGLGSGEFSYETQVCLEGTQDWLPLTEWANEIEPPAPAAQPPINRAAVYQQLTEKPKNTPLRIFWGVVILLGGIGQAMLAFIRLQFLDFDRPDQVLVTVLVGAFAIIALYVGTRLMMAPKSN